MWKTLALLTLVSCPWSVPARASTQDGPAVAPFSAVRWSVEQPQVLVDGTWYRPLEIAGVPVAQILVHSRLVHGRRWQKRFGEDLPQLLDEMGLDCPSKVVLKLRHLDSEEVVELKDVAMTAEKRQAVWDYNHGERPPEVSRVTPRLTSEQVTQDLDQLQRHLEQEFSYLGWRDVDHRAALDAIRAAAREGMERKDLALRLARLIARFGDGHAGLRESMDDILPTGYLPFLLAPAEEGWVAFRPDRSGFVDDERPLITHLDGDPIEKWMEVVGVLVPDGSPQLKTWRGARQLRYLNWARTERGMEPSENVEVRLTDVRGRKARTQTLELADRRPLYGAWPRTESGWLEDEVGYLRVSEMDDSGDFRAELQRWMEEFQHAAGIILDVRGNGGGTRHALLDLLPWFLEPELGPRVVNVGALRVRPGQAMSPDGLLQNRFLHPLTASHWSKSQRALLESFQESWTPEWTPPAEHFSPWHYLLVEPRPEGTASAPLVVLMDPDCFSATDIFLGAFAEVPGVTLMGLPSGGGSGRSQTVTLQHSQLRLRLSSMASFRPDGRLYEGRGVEPDVRVAPRAADFVGRGDAMLAAAREHLLR